MHQDGIGDDGAEELIFKVALVGPVNAGKTTLARRLVQCSGSDLLPDIAGDDQSGVDPVDPATVVPTVGVDFASLVLENAAPGLAVRLQLWDTAGGDSNESTHSVALRGAAAVLVVYDGSAAPDLLQAAEDDVGSHWLALAEENGIATRLVVANKIDLRSAGRKDQLNSLAIPCSAHTGRNVLLLLRRIVEECLQQMDVVAPWRSNTARLKQQKKADAAATKQASKSALKPPPKPGTTAVPVDSPPQAGAGAHEPSDSEPSNDSDAEAAGGERRDRKAKKKEAMPTWKKVAGVCLGLLVIAIIVVAVLWFLGVLPPGSDEE